MDMLIKIYANPTLKTPLDCTRPAFTAPDEDFGTDRKEILYLNGNCLDYPDWLAHPSLPSRTCITRLVHIYFDTRTAGIQH